MLIADFENDDHLTVFPFSSEKRSSSIVRVKATKHRS